MSSLIQKSWEAKRIKAIRRLVALWEKHDPGAHSEEVNIALDFNPVSCYLNPAAIGGRLSSSSHFGCFSVRRMPKYGAWS